MNENGVHIRAKVWCTKLIYPYLTHLSFFAVLLMVHMYIFKKKVMVNNRCQYHLIIIFYVNTILKLSQYFWIVVIGKAYVI